MHLTLSSNRNFNSKQQLTTQYNFPNIKLIKNKNKNNSNVTSPNIQT